MSDATLYDLVAARLADGRCPSLIDARSGFSPEAVEMLALSDRGVVGLVHPLSEEAARIGEVSMLVSQKEEETFGVSLASVGMASLELFRPVRAEVKAALRGWINPGSSKPVEYAGGRLAEYFISQDGGRITWLMRFRAFTQSTYEVQQ